MKKLLSQSFSMLFLILLYGTLHSQPSGSETLRFPMKNPKNTAILHLMLARGSVFVERHNKPVIIISHTTGQNNSKRSHGTPETGSSILVFHENNTVRIRQYSPKQSYHFKIKVPEKCDLKLLLTEGGDIKVEGLEGMLDITNRMGNITLENVSGSLLISALNGFIKADIRRLNQDGVYALTNLNHDISVTLPGDASFLLKYKTETGKMESDFKLAAEPVVSKHKDGSFTKIMQLMQAEVNHGGVEILLNNVYGNIFLHKQK